MILRLYKSNQTPVLFVLPILAVVLWLPGMLSPEEIDFRGTSPLFTQLREAFSPLIGQIVSLVLLLLSAYILNSIINNNDIFDRNTFLPALFYVLIMSSIKEYHVLSPIIISNFFVLLALRRLFSIYRQAPCKQEVFDASILLLIGSLFYFPTIILFPLVWIALSILRPFVWREWVLPILAVGLAGVYMLVFLFWDGEFSNWDRFTQLNETQERFQKVEIGFNWTMYVAFGLLVVSLVLAGYYLTKMTKNSSIRFRKISTFFLYVISLFIIQIVLEKIVLKNEMYTLLGAIPLSIVLTFYFQNATKNWLSGLLFYGMLAIVIVNIFWL